VDDQLNTLIDTYQPTQATKELLQSMRIVLLVGISGAGKNTIMQQLLQSDDFHFVISHTTRPPRKNRGILERDGVEYHFVSHETMYAMLTKGEFVEAKKYTNNIYGTSVKEFELAANDNKIAVADVEVQGVEEYMSISPQTVIPIFLLPPNFEMWRERFYARYEGITGQSGIHERMQTAVSEIQYVLHHPHFSIVVNDNLDEAVVHVRDIINGEVDSEVAERYGQKVAYRLLEQMKHELTN
jgi:guanylate kinase